MFLYKDPFSYRRFEELPDSFVRKNPSLLVETKLVKQSSFYILTKKEWNKTQDTEWRKIGPESCCTFLVFYWFRQQVDCTLWGSDASCGAHRAEHRICRSSLKTEIGAGTALAHVMPRAGWSRPHTRVVYAKGIKLQQNLCNERLKVHTSRMTFSSWVIVSLLQRIFLIFCDSSWRSQFATEKEYLLQKRN